MRIRVALTPAEQLSAPIGVVIDVLRATTTIAQALASGYERVICTTEVDEARAIAVQEGDCALGGERHTVKIEGFDFGNSPTEYLGTPAARTLIFSTTNGTPLLVSAAERCETVLLGSLATLDAVVQAVRAAGADDVVLLCAGVLGELAIDDVYVAGRLAELLGGDLCDSAWAAVRLARSFPTAVAGLDASQSGRNLHGTVLESDIAWCARESHLAVVPRFARMIGTAAEVTL